jgi:hypothetical protein
LANSSPKTAVCQSRLWPQQGSGKCLAPNQSPLGGKPRCQALLQPIQAPKRLFARAVSGLNMALTSAWHLICPPLGGNPRCQALLANSSPKTAVCQSCLWPQHGSDKCLAPSRSTDYPLPVNSILPRGLKHRDHVLRRHAGLHVVDRAEGEASPGSQVVYAAFDLVRELLRRAEELVLNERPSADCSTAAVAVVRTGLKHRLGRILPQQSQTHASRRQGRGRITFHASRITFHASRITFHVSHPRTPHQTEAGHPPAGNAEF